MSFVNLKGERWDTVQINGEYSQYRVSNKGRLERGGKLLKCCSIKNEYISCSLRHNGRYYSTRLHRLVALAFKKNSNNYPEVNHKDGKKNNNVSSNLEWCTHLRNIRHSFEIGLCVRPKGKNSHLYDKGRRVLNVKTGETYSSVATAARALGVPRTTISAEINGYREPKLNLIGL